MLTFRKAELKDVPAVFEMINHYAAEGSMLRRTLTELYECVREFLVAEDDGKVMGCGALKFYAADLAEIRSLCVAPGLQSRGLGRGLTARLLEEAEQFQLKTVFALTTSPDFFSKCGFREMARERFPMKIWRDCLRCEKYFRCNEKTMVIDLSAGRSSQSESRADESSVAV
ncbi:MAG TPA: N-acetyltransferase [Terriglobia bacterium]|nr:N-acetyltransferase [Terriglobia bacterium]